MTKVKFSKNSDESLVSITGHAMYANMGSDIVCAGISTLAYTIGNQLLELNEEVVEVEIDEGKFLIRVLEPTDKTDLLIDTLVLGLGMIEEQYGDNIEIKEV